MSELSELRDTEELDKEIRDSAPVSSNAGGGSGGMLQNFFLWRLPMLFVLAANSTQDIHSREGVAIFRAFDHHVSSLDRQLQGFANAVRQLGSSVGLLNATYHLRGALLQIEHLFRENVSASMMYAITA